MDALVSLRATPSRRILALAVAALAVTQSHAGSAPSRSTPNLLSAASGGPQCSLGWPCPCESFVHRVHGSQSTSSLASPSLRGGMASTKIRRTKSELEIELEDLGGVDITEEVFKRGQTLRNHRYSSESSSCSSSSPSPAGELASSKF